MTNGPQETSDCTLLRFQNVQQEGHISGAESLGIEVCEPSDCSEVDEMCSMKAILMN